MFFVILYIKNKLISVAKKPSILFNLKKPIIWSFRPKNLEILWMEKLKKTKTMKKNNEKFKFLLKISKKLGITWNLKKKHIK